MKLHLKAPRTSHRRHAATLVEVLMSLMILSLGVVSVFTLFPLTLVSSIKANQLTTSRLYADQIAAAIRARPELVLGAREWQPNQNYTNGSVVTGRILQGSTSPPSNEYYRCIAAGTSSFMEPEWPSVTIAVPTITEATNVEWQRIPLPFQNGTPPGMQFTPYKYVVDPMGAINSIPLTNPLRHAFGNYASQLVDNNFPRPNGLLLRTNCGIENELTAIQTNFLSQDSWTTVFTAVPLTFTRPTDPNNRTSTITFDPTISIDGLPLKTDPYDWTIPARVIAISADGRRSATANLIGMDVANKQITVDSRLNGADPIGSVRVETYEPRYTWLAAVDRTTPTFTTVQCAIFFNRDYRDESEQIYPALLIPGTLDQVEFDSTVMDSIESDIKSKPYAPVGGYVFDVDAVKFHRIVDVKKTWGTNSLSSITVSPVFNGPQRPRNLIFMPGIVRVYEMSL
ncbi:type IV pilus modification PilV family protein [Planctomicrobium sp. SH668]|uniref:type IV pilus modification PilV family protein n=1 Tax=Planctomicrobium sp. SH668 TaxID=3448126 RepID=UPI003F5BB571